MTLRLFEAYGIEIELMLVDAESLAIAPAADWLLARAAGQDDILELQSAPEGLFEINDGPVGWCNELALHVIEFRCNGPAATLAGLAGEFQKQVNQANALLAERGLCLLPGAMHPWMNPDREFKLWPHGDTPFYDQFDAIFDCRGHGWSNLQSMHINLPFGNEAEFGRLHAAIRAALPLLPSLAAASPFCNGVASAWANTRLSVYRDNCKRIPSVTGQIIPEPVYSYRDYQGLLATLYADIAPFDPEGTLQEEWLNARGAIARFDRNAIEIRVLDTQECPAADLAVAELVCALLRLLCEEAWVDLATLQVANQERLVAQFEIGMRVAEQAEVSDSDYLRLFGWQAGTVPTAAQLWASIAQEATKRGWLSTEAQQWFKHYQAQGSLSTRLKRAVGEEVNPERLQQVYQQLTVALAQGQWFTAAL